MSRKKPPLILERILARFGRHREGRG